MRPCAAAQLCGSDAPVNRCGASPAPSRTACIRSTPRAAALAARSGSQRITRAPLASAPASPSAAGLPAAARRSAAVRLAVSKPATRAAQHLAPHLLQRAVVSVARSHHCRCRPLLGGLKGRLLQLRNDHLQHCARASVARAPALRACQRQPPDQRARESEKEAGCARSASQSPSAAGAPPRCAAPPPPPAAAPPPPAPPAPALRCPARRATKPPAAATARSPPRSARCRSVSEARVGGYISARARQHAQGGVQRRHSLLRARRGRAAVRCSRARCTGWRGQGRGRRRGGRSCSKVQPLVDPRVQPHGHGTLREQQRGVAAGGSPRQRASGRAAGDRATHVSS